MAKTARKASPKGFGTVTTYLIVTGARQALSFMENAFGAKVDIKHVNDEGAIVHAVAAIGDTRLMVGDACMGGKPIPAMLYMYVPDCDAVYKKAVKAGAKSLKPPADQFYGDRAAAVLDKAGNTWWIATHKESLTKPELRKRVAEMKKKIKK